MNKGELKGKKTSNETGRYKPIPNQVFQLQPVGGIRKNVKKASKGTGLGTEGLGISGSSPPKSIRKSPITGEKGNI